jgi:hypothetical protein
MNVLFCFEKTAFAWHWKGLLGTSEEGVYMVFTEADYDKEDNSFEEGKLHFIRQCQHQLLKSEDDIIYTPEIYQDDFWTREYIIRLAAKLRRPRRRKKQQVFKNLTGWCFKEDMELVKSLLSSNWNRFKHLDEKTLAKRFNAEFGTNFKPRTLAQLAYRANLLLTNRPSGPLPRYLLQRGAAL